MSAKIRWVSDVAVQNAELGLVVPGEVREVDEDVALRLSGEALADGQFVIVEEEGE